MLLKKKRILEIRVFHRTATIWYKLNNKMKMAQYGRMENIRKYKRPGEHDFGLNLYTNRYW